MFTPGNFALFTRMGSGARAPRGLVLLATTAVVIAGLAVGTSPVSAAPSVTISNLPVVAAVGSTFTPTYSGGFTGTASVASSTATVCTVSSGVVSFVSGGACVLTPSATDPLTGSAQVVWVGTQRVFNGPNGSVNSMAQDADGITYAGGSFTKWDAAVTGGGAVVLDASWPAPSVDRTRAAVAGTVSASAPDGSGGWYIGGSFTSVGGVDRNNLAHILADGSVDGSWNPNADAQVSTLAVSGTTVYVGGKFTTIGGTARSRLAAIGTDGTLTSWDPNASNDVLSLAVSNSTVYVGGYFTTIGGTARSRLAAIGTDGTLTSWDPNADNDIYALAVSNSTVYVGGRFTTIGGTARSKLAAIGTDGTLASWDPSSNNNVWAVAVSGSTVYAGGEFTTIGGTARNRLAAIGTDGTLASWDPSVTGGTVMALAVSGTTVYAGGLFTTVGTSTRTGLAAIDSDGTVNAWDPGPNIASVTSISVSGSTLYLGGGFLAFGGATTRNRLAAIGTDGALTSWDPNADGTVNAVAVSGSNVYVGGAFSNVGGTARGKLAAITTAGVLASWNPTANSTVNALAISGTTVFIGGAFTTITTSSTTGRTYAAAVDTSGILQSWYPVLNGEAKTLQVSGTTVYMGGSFTQAFKAAGVSCSGSGGALSMSGISGMLNFIKAGDIMTGTNIQSGTTVASYNSATRVLVPSKTAGTCSSVTFTKPRNRLASLSTTATQQYNFTTWNPNAGNTVNSLAVNSAGSVVYAGGAFLSVGGTGRKFLAAINTDTTGTLVSTWDPNANAAVNALAVSSSYIYAGGAFTTLGLSTSLTTRNGLAAIASDGTVSAWNPNADGAVKSLLLSSGSTIHVGGSFNRVAYSTSASPVYTPLLNADYVRVTATSPGSIQYGSAVPSITYSSQPSTTSADWTTEPTCAVYASSDTTYATALTGSAVAPGTYVTHCSGGTLAASGLTAVYVNGSLVITKRSVTVTASSPSVDSSTSVPSIGYSTSPATVAADWSVEPSCAAYASSDTTFATPLSGAQSVGTYVTHCSGGVSANYDPTSYVDGSLTVTQAAATKTDVTVTADSPSITDVTSVPSTGYSTSPATVAADWSVEPSCAAYASSDTTFATPLSGAQSVGTYVTHCSGGVSDSYDPTSYVDGSLTVTQAGAPPTDVTVTADSPSITYGTSVSSIGYSTSPATVAADWSVEPSCAAYASSDSSFATPLTGVQPAGTYVTHCSGGSSDSYSPTSYVDGLLTIAKASSSTVISCPTSVTYTGLPQSPCTAAVTGAGDLATTAPVTYGSNTDAGTATADASFAGDSNHDGSTATQVAFTIDRASSSTVVTCSPKATTFDGAAQTLCVAEVSGAGGLSLSGLVPSYSGNVNAGTATASYVFDGDANHEGSQGSDSFSIDPASLVVTASSTSITFGDEVPSVSYSTSPVIGVEEWASEPVCGVFASSDSSFVSPLSGVLDAGSYVTHCSAGVAANYTTTLQVDGSLTVDPASSSTVVSCPVSSVTYDGLPQSPCTAEVTGPGGLSLSLDVTYGSNTDAGTATADASFAGDSNHSASSGSSLFVIDKASSSTVVSCPANVTYTGSAIEPCTAEVTGAGGLSLSWGVTYGSNTDAGTASADASYVGDGNHEASSGSSSFVIDKASSSTVVSCPANVTYTGAAIEPCTADVTGAGGLSTTVSVTYGSNTDAGTATADASYAGDSNHDGSSAAQVTFVIDKASSSTVVSCPVSSVTYDGLPQSPCTAEVTGAGGLSLLLDVTYGSNTDAGTATADASYAGDSNHDGSSAAQVTFVIDKASSSTVVSCPVSSVTYDGLPQSPCTAEVTGAGGLSLLLDVTYGSNTDAGTATADASYVGDGNHEASSGSSSFTIDRASSSTVVSCPVSSVTYDGLPQSPCTAEVTGAGGLSLLLDVTYGSNTDAGTASADASYVGDGNHEASSGSSSFTIDRASSSTVVTCSPRATTFDGAAQTLCVAEVSGAGGLSLSGLVPSYSGNVNAGTATATYVFGGDANHEGSQGSDSFSIDPASLVVTASSTSITFGDVVPSVSYSTSPVIGVEEWTSEPVCGVFASSDSSFVSPLSGVLDAGSYVTHCSAGVAANYTTTLQVDGSLTVDPASSSTVVSCPANVTFTGSALEPCTADVTGAGGLSTTVSVTYGSNTNAGTATADASYAGDSNHDGSTATQVTFVIDKASSSTVVSCPANVTYTGSAIEPCTAEVTGAGGLSLSWGVTYGSNTDAGTATADASYAGDSNHEGSTAAQVTFVIDKASSTTVISCPANVTFTGLPLEPCTAEVTGDGGLTTTAPVTYGSNTDAGTATADATYAGDSNHDGSSATQVTFVIDRASSSTVISCPANVTFTGLSLEPCTADVTGDGGLTTTALVVYGSNTDAGTATADATYAGDSNHDGSTAAQVTFVIDKASSSTVISCPANVTFTGLSLEPCTAEVTGDGGLTTTAPVTYGSNTDAGTATADASYAGDSNHDGSSAAQVTFVIDKASSTTVISCPANVTFTGLPLEPCTAEVTGDGGLTTTAPVTYGSNTDAGTATADARYAGDSNHDGSSAAQVTFVIDKASSTTVISCPASVTFTGSALEPCTADVTGDGGLTTTALVVYGSNTNAGTATADASYAGDSNHDGSSAAQVTFVIDRASSSTVISCPTSVTFTGSAQTPCSASVTGVGGLSTTAAVVYGSNTNAGTATADATYAGDSNHDGSSAAQVTFTIDKASVAVIAPVVIIAYPTAVPQVGFATYPITGATDWTTAPLCAAYAPSGSVALTGVQSVGVYETRCTGGVSPNYVATSYLNGSLTITKAPTTTTINCTSPTYTGLALTPCTATVTGAGRTVATGVPTYSNNVDAGANTASASFSFAGDANLQASSATVTFTIKKAPSTVTVTCSVTTAVYTGAAITPCGSSATVTGVGGLATTVPVVYASNIDVTNENSSATATATYAGDNNHSPATASKRFSITKAPSTAVITCSGTTFPYTGAAITPCSVAISSAGLLATATPSYSGNTNAGTATASYTYPGDANRASAAATPVTFTITKVPSSAVITCTGTTFVYTGAAITPCSVAVTGIGLATTVAPTYLNNRNVGTATASYTYPGDTNHTASAAATPVTFTITKAPSAAVITCAGTTFTYTAAAITPCSVAVTGPGLASTVSPTYVNNINVGTATASYTYAGDANHTPSAPATPVTFAITQASSVVAVTCPTTAVTFTGAALTPCRATVTAPGVPSTVSPTYANNINPGTATASYSFAGTANVTPSSGSATFTIISATPTITYTGTQMANSSATATLTLASATVPAGCTGTLTYALDRNPTTGVAGTFLLPASPVSTSGWRNGVYVVTTARADTAGCAAVSDSSSTITVASTTARAYGGGNYTVAGSPRVSLGWFIGPSTTSVSGEFQFIQNNRWKFTGTLNTYTRATSTGTATGTGTLSYWSASTSTWVSVGTAIPVRLVTTNGASGTVSTTFTYTPKAGEPALPSTVAQRIGTTIKVG